MTNETNETNDKPSVKTQDAKDVSSADAPKVRVSSASKAAAKSGGKAKSSAPDVQKSGGFGLLWLIFILVVIGGAMVAGWSVIGPLVPPQVRTVVEDVRVRLGLASPPPFVPEIARAPLPAPEVRSEPPVAQVPVVDVVDLAPVVEQLTARLDVLEGQLGAVSSGDGRAALAATGDLVQTLSALKVQLATLSARMDTLEQAQAARVNPMVKTQALVLAATQLRARLMGDTAFAAELKALESIAADDAVVRAVVARLRPNAAVGIPSEAALIARFAPVAIDIVRMRAVSGEEGWLGTVKNSLSKLITVRQTDPTKITNDVERAVSIAEAALQLGDLAGAVKALTPLQGPPSDAAAAWLGDARARVDAEAALEDLYNHALEALAQAGGG